MKQLLLFLLPTLLLGAVSRQYKVSDFTKLDISGPFKTVFSQTGTNSITVNADTERRADQIVVKQDGNTVYITTNVTDYQLGLGNL
jgi:hypothetical protein